jgi:hypothetical protein
VKTIPLTGVEGRIDHLALDALGKRLFIAAIGNNSVEVVDLDKGQQIHSITGLNEPQGIVFNSNTQEIAVASGDGTCKFYGARTYELLRTIQLAADADNLRLDVSANRIYAGCGDGMISALNATNGGRIAGGDLPLPEHPEAFEIELAGTRIFANLPDHGSVAVLDRQKQVALAAWSLDSARANFPMALDETDHRLFVGCRHPARLVILNTDQGKVVTALPCVGDADDVFFDETLQRVFVSGGEGFIDVFHMHDADHYVPDGTITTAPGARTSLLSPELHQLYAAVPHRGEQPAEIRVYDLLAK